MTRPLAFAAGVAAAVSLVSTATGCSSTSAGGGAADGSAMTPGALTDASLDDSGGAACVAAGGQCLFGDLGCFGVIGPQDCGAGAFCCLPNAVPTNTATSCTDANVQLIQASNYDQSCKTASDCIGVGEGNPCYPCAIACPTAAINASAMSQYLSDVAKTPAVDQGGGFCGCPETFNPCCRGGTCHADFQCQNPVPAGDAGACATAGGQCVFGGCANAGPQSCGTAGMFCCLSTVADAGADAATDGSPADAGAE